MLPIMADHFKRVCLEKRPSLIAGLRQRITPEEARMIATFFSSELRRNLCPSWLRITIPSAVQLAMPKPAKRNASVLGASARQVFLAFSPDEQAEFEKLLTEKPELLKAMELSSMPELRARKQALPFHLRRRSGTN